MKWSQPYRGDTAGKVEIRNDLYRSAAAAWDKTGRPGGYAVTLAGKMASEVPLLRDYLRWDPRLSLFVDIDGFGIGMVKASWPDALVHHGLMQSALEQVPAIGFLNLDFMGRFNDDVEASCRAAFGKLLPNAVVSYTFLRCREGQFHKTFKKLKTSAKEVLSKSQQRNLNLVRWVGSAALLQETLGLRDPQPLIISSYQSSSPMGVIALQNR